MFYESGSSFEVVPVLIHATTGRDHQHEQDWQHTRDMQHHKRKWDPSTPGGLLDHSSGDTHKTDAL